MLHLRKPYHPFYEIPEIVLLAEDPSINVLVEPIGDHRGNEFRPLVKLGLTEEALAIMIDMVNITAVMEAFSMQTLKNPSIIPLITRRNEIVHRLLSLIPGCELVQSPESSLYECCRLAALIYALAGIYPIPTSTGTCRKLVLQFQSAMEEVRLKELYGCGAKFYIWALFLAGVAAERMPQRLWFVKRLKGLLLTENISRWSEVKHLAMSFLWMSSVCDEGGMNLWDDVAEGLRV
jgi:hypothetical protein